MARGRPCSPSRRRRGTARTARRTRRAPDRPRRRSAHPAEPVEEAAASRNRFRTPPRPAGTPRFARRDYALVLRGRVRSALSRSDPSERKGAKTQRTRRSGLPSKRLPGLDSVDSVSGWQPWVLPSKRRSSLRALRASRLRAFRERRPAYAYRLLVLAVIANDRALVALFAPLLPLLAPVVAHVRAAPGAPVAL